MVVVTASHCFSFNRTVFAPQHTYKSLAEAFKWTDTKHPRHTEGKLYNIITQITGRVVSIICKYTESGGLFYLITRCKLFHCKTNLQKDVQVDNYQAWSKHICKHIHPLNLCGCNMCNYWKNKKRKGVRIIERNIHELKYSFGVNV